jgi:hypothetical protein
MAACGRTREPHTRGTHAHENEHRTLECKFATDVAGAVQAALAAEDIRSLDDVVDVLDEARLRNPSAAAVRPPLAVASVRCAARCVQGLLAVP